MTKSVSRISILPVYVSLVAVVYLFSLLLPTPKNPIVSVQSIEQTIFGSSISSNFPWQTSNFWFCLVAIIFLVVLVALCNITVLLLEGNKLSHSLGICLTITISAIPILFGLSSNLFTSPVGILFSLLASGITGTVIWIIFLLVSIVASKFGAKDLFAEVKNN
jgi:hypothetical protein